MDLTIEGNITWPAAFVGRFPNVPGLYPKSNEIEPFPINVEIAMD